jgi:hypothetical protein
MKAVASRVLRKRVSRSGWEFEVKWNKGPNSWVELRKLWEPGSARALAVLDEFAAREGVESESYESGGMVRREALSIEPMRTSKGWRFKTAWSVGAEMKREETVSKLREFMSCNPEVLGSSKWTSANQELHPVVDETLSSVGGTWKQIHRKFVVDKGYFEGMVDGVSGKMVPCLSGETTLSPVARRG